MAEPRCCNRTISAARGSTTRSDVASYSSTPEQQCGGGGCFGQRAAAPPVLTQLLILGYYAALAQAIRVHAGLFRRAAIS